MSCATQSVAASSTGTSSPSNILIAPGGIPRLAGFGIARAIDASWTLTGIVHGSAPCIAPEQANGGDVDGRTDVYALGCVLYEMLTGRPPFTGDDALGIVYRHLHETPQPPSEVNPAVLPVFDGVVLKALQKDPDERFASADHLRAALLAPAAITPAMGSAVTTQVLHPDVTGVRPSPPLPGRRHKVPASPPPPRPPWRHGGCSSRRWSRPCCWLRWSRSGAR